MSAKCYSGQKISLKIGVKCYNARTFQKNLRRAAEMAVRRVLFCRQHNGKFRTLARRRNHFDIAALPRYDLAGQIQANTHALLFVYFFLTIEAPENGGLIAFGNALAGVGHFDLHIHFPQHHPQRFSRLPGCTSPHCPAG